jgi:hypothetical protein
MANFFTRLVARTLGPPAADGMVQPVLTSMFAPGPGDGAIGEWTDPDRLPADLSRLLPEAEVPTNSLGLVPSNDAPIAPIAAPVSPPSLLRHSHITVSEPLDSALPQAAPTASPLRRLLLPIAQLFRSGLSLLDRIWRRTRIRRLPRSPLVLPLALIQRSLATDLALRHLALRHLS